MTSLPTIVCGNPTCGVDMSLAPRVAIEMAPGHDGQPWWLCVRCWVEGTRVKGAPVDLDEADLPPNAVEKKKTSRARK